MIMLHQYYTKHYVKTVCPFWFLMSYLHFSYFQNLLSFQFCHCFNLCLMLLMSLKNSVVADSDVVAFYFFVFGFHWFSNLLFPIIIFTVLNLWLKSLILLHIRGFFLLLYAVYFIVSFYSYQRFTPLPTISDVAEILCCHFSHWFSFWLLVCCFVF